MRALLALTSSSGGSRGPGPLLRAILPSCALLAFPPTSRRVSTPTRTEVLTSATRCHTPRTFRPRGFSPPRRFAPHADCRFVAPCCRSKVRPVSADRPRCWSEDLHRLPACFPEPQHHTPRRIPLNCSRTVSPQPLPSCRSHRPSLPVSHRSDLPQHPSRFRDAPISTARDRPVADESTTGLMTTTERHTKACRTWGALTQHTLSRVPSLLTVANRPPNPPRANRSPCGPREVSWSPTDPGVVWSSSRSHQRFASPR
jgi:hypothetical protein